MAEHVQEALPVVDFDCPFPSENDPGFHFTTTPSERPRRAEAPRRDDGPLLDPPPSSFKDLMTRQRLEHQSLLNPVEAVWAPLPPNAPATMTVATEPRLRAWLRSREARVIGVVLLVIAAASGFTAWRSTTARAYVPPAEPTPPVSVAAERPTIDRSPVDRTPVNSASLARPTSPPVVIVPDKNVPDKNLSDKNLPDKNSKSVAAPLPAPKDNDPGPAVVTTTKPSLPTFGPIVRSGAPAAIAGGAKRVSLGAPPATPSAAPPSKSSDSDPVVPKSTPVRSPAAAPSEPPGPAITPAEAIRAGLQSVLQEYRAANARLDADAVQAIWPSVNARALQRAFDQLSAQQFDFESCSIEPSTTRASATCVGTASYTPRVGTRIARVESRQWMFQFRKVGNAWVIESVVAK